MKRLVEEHVALNIHELARSGVFKAPMGTPCTCTWTDVGGQKVFAVNFWVEGDPETPALRMIERSVGSLWIPTSGRIELGFVQCHLGGRKRLFRCPGADESRICGQPAQKLYLVEGRWICRKCGELTYTICRKHDRRVDALLRSPMDLIEALHGDNAREQLLAVKAIAAASRRMQHKASSRAGDAINNKD